MARKEIASAAATAASPAQGRSCAAEKRRARSDGAGGSASVASSAMGALRCGLPEHEAAQLVVAGCRGQLSHRAAVVEDEDAGCRRGGAGRLARPRRAAR